MSYKRRNRIWIPGGMDIESACSLAEKLSKDTQGKETVFEFNGQQIVVGGAKTKAEALRKFYKRLYNNT